MRLVPRLLSGLELFREGSGLSLERMTPVVDTGSKCLNVRALHGAAGDAGTT